MRTQSTSKSYFLTVSDNNSTSQYGPFKTKRDAVKERLQVISACNYLKKYGFKRETYSDMIVFRHAVYSSVVMKIIKQ